MKARLLSRRYGDFAFGAEATVGRAPGSTVTLDSSVVSQEHARITFDAGRARYVLEDLGSLNGTELDGLRIQGPETLEHLHVVDFGGCGPFILHVVDVEVEPAATAPAPEGTRVGAEVPELPDILRRAAPAPDEPAGGATLVETGLPPLPAALREAAPETAEGYVLELGLAEGRRRFILVPGDNVVGRSRRAAVRVDLQDLSRRHAVISLREGKIFVRDLGSRNGTLVGGEPIAVEVELAPGATVVFGRLEGRIVAATAEEGAP